MSAVRRIVLAAGVLAVVLPAGPAFAYGPPPHIPIIELSTSVVVPGDGLTVHGIQFTPHGRVNLSLHSAPVLLAVVTTDRDGAFTARLTIPAGTAPGEHEIQALDVATGDVAMAALLVRAPLGPPPSPPPPVATTGVAIAEIGGVGVALVAVGQLLIVAGRRRRTKRA